MKKVVILGAGISGLTLAWYLKKKYGPTLDIKILEKDSRPGGWIQTHYVQDSLFDQGPRSCRIQGNGFDTLNLIQELGITDKILTADPTAKHRFIYSDKKLQKLPEGFFSLLCSPWKNPIIKGLWKDLKTPIGLEEDESITAFITRRFNQEMAELLADPLATGIYAGDIKQLSVRSCFPDWFERERNYGGILKSLWKKKKNSPEPSSPFTQRLKKRGCFTLLNGMESLVQALADKLSCSLEYQSEAISLSFNQNKTYVGLANGKIYEAAHVYSTLPSFVLGRLLSEQFPFLAEFLHSIPYASVAVVNLGYYKQVLKTSGFGYLIPSKENELILGMVWDSCVFPEQNQIFQTRLCVMLGGAHHPGIEAYSEEKIMNKALEGLAHHLQIHGIPDIILVKKALSSIPQYLVGHHRKKTEFYQQIKDQIPSLSILGTAFNGVSVNDCISHAKVLSENLLDCKK